jgi:penicillin amidase/acyl-homoserine-lactone acylase
MLRKLIAGVILVAAVAHAVFYFTAPRGAEPADFASVSDVYDVRIIRDAFGVPHIYGDRDIDVAFGLAYAHAEDDYDTIEDVLLATRGDLALKHGPDAGKTDYLIAFMGVWDVVNAQYESSVSAQARALAEAYADGLNFYASRHAGAVHPSVLPVTGRDIVAGFTFKTPLFYGFDAAVAAVVEGRYGTGLDKTAGLQVTKAAQPALGSQGIAVAPARSADGHTRLLVNSHQPLTGPVAWYEARLKSGEGWDMAGGTFPGSPLILHGHGPTLGWASTVNKPDLVDVYALTLNPADAGEYRLDGAWQALEETEVEIEVCLYWPVCFTVEEPLYRSAHGPVFKTSKGAFALRWAGMENVGALDALFAMNKARTKAEFEGALARNALPSINYVYADKDGNIAHYYNALLPRRTPGVDYGGLVPGDRSDLIWQDYHTFGEVPKTVNPPSGLVFNANNTPFVSSDGAGVPVAADFPSEMGVERQMTNRAQRILEVYGQAERISAADFRNFKYDNRYSEQSLAMQIRRAVAGLTFEPDSPYADGQALLAAWDGATGADNTAAALAVLTAQPVITANMRAHPGPPVEEAFRSAVDHLMTHFGRIDPPWGDVNRLVRGSRSWPLSGAPDVLRAVYGEVEEGTGILRDVAGDSYIMFVDWAPGGSVEAHSIHNFGSATLDAGSPHHADQAPLFAQEKERRLPLRLADVEAEKTGDIRLGGLDN